MVSQASVGQMLGNEGREEPRRILLRILQVLLTFLYLLSFLLSFPSIPFHLWWIHKNEHHSPYHIFSASSYCVESVPSLKSTRFYKLFLTFSGCLVIKKHGGKIYAKFANSVKRKIVSNDLKYFHFHLRSLLCWLLLCLKFL